MRSFLYVTEYPTKYYRYMDDYLRNRIVDIFQFTLIYFGVEGVNIDDIVEEVMGSGRHEELLNMERYGNQDIDDIRFAVEFCIDVIELLPKYETLVTNEYQLTDATIEFVGEVCYINFEYEDYTSFADMD